jgi:hypothetical protein
LVIFIHTRMGKEILTIQLGHKANYLATHFWNSQVFVQVTSLIIRKPTSIMRTPTRSPLSTMMFIFEQE